MNSDGQPTALASGIRVFVGPAEQDVANTNKKDDGIDIVAIHGIGADPDKTWTGRGHAGEEVNWLSDSEMLPKAVPTARIMRFGYESAWYGTEKNEPKKTQVFDVAEMLLKQLELLRQGITRPIIFIAHSYGGLVVMQTLRRSFDNPLKWSHLFRFTAGVVFFGTPFRGRKGLTLAQIVEAVAQRNPDLQIHPETMALSVEENPYLQNIVHQFTETRRGDHPIPLWCFYETKPSPIGKTLRNNTVRDDYLIPMASACLDSSKNIERFPLERHHYNLQKFSGPSDPGYLAVEKAIVNLATKARNYLRECHIKNTWKSCYHIGLARNPRFTGRNAVLNALEQKFFSYDQCPRIALVGLGGVGKTQIALHFAYQIMGGRPDYSIFWVPLVSHESVEQAYVEIAKKIGLQKSSEHENSKELVCRHLSSDKVGKWLFVVDNADDQDLILGSADITGLEEYLPQSRNGITLLTTRSRQVAVAFAQSNVIDIEQMDRVEATDLLEKSLIQKPLPQDEPLVAELLAHLTFLPLAITQAAAYLNQTRAPIQTYLGFLRGAEKDVTRVLGREFHDATRYRGSRNAIGTTWLVTFEQIKKSDLLAVDLLSFISCIESKTIPQSMLPNAGPEDLAWALGTLCNYSFLVRRGGTSTFDMHSLVHMATRGWVEKQGRTEQVVEHAICHLAKIFPPDNPVNYRLRREYLPHVTRLLHQSDQHKTDDAYYLFREVGGCFDEDRRFKEAAKCYEEVFRWEQDHLSENDYDRLTSEHELARAYLEDRRIEDAIKIFEHVVAVQKEILDEKNHSRLASTHELASAYLEDRRIEDAIKIFEHVVAVRKEILDEKDHSRLASEHELARAYLEDRRIEDAIKIFEHVVAVRKETLDEKDHSRLASEHEFASAYLEDRRIEDAIKIFEHVVAVRKETLDEKDHSRLASEHELARAYLEVRRIEDGIKIFEHVVAVQKETLDEKDHSRLASEHELARAYLKDRRIEDAIKIFEHVVAIRNETLDEKDHSRLASEHELARAYLKDQRIEDAIKIFEHVVAIRKEILDEKDHSRLASEHALGMAYLKDRRIEDAIKIFEHVVAVQKETLDEKDHSRLASEHELARAYLKDQRIEDAIKIFEHVVAVQNETLDEKDHSRLASEHALGMAYLKDRRIEDAIKIFEHVVAVQKETLDEKDHSRLASEHELARAYLKNQRIEDAIKIFEHVVAVQNETLDEKDHSRLASEHALGRAYLKDQRIEDAIKIFEHVVAVRKEILDEKDHDRLASERGLTSAYLAGLRVEDAILGRRGLTGGKFCRRCQQS